MTTATALSNAPPSPPLQSHYDHHDDPNNNNNTTNTQQHRRRRRSLNDKRHRLLQAKQRASSYYHRPSTIGCRLFFSHDEEKEEEEEEEEEEWESLPERILRLERHLRQTLEDNPQLTHATASQQLTAAIFAAAPPHFLTSFRHFFSAALATKRTSTDDSMDDSMDSSSSIPENNIDDERVYAALRYLTWLPTPLTPPLGESLHSSILSTIRSRITSNFESPSLLSSSLHWNATIVTPWVIHTVLGCPPTSELANEWRIRLEYATAEAFGVVRMGEIFDIIAEYPDSLPAVRELRVALERTRMHERLAGELRRALGRRLIHPGANTSQIIEVYINTIKVLRVIDPSDGLLEAVAQPVRSYLRGRSDTVRCIITSLTDEKAGGDLYEELRRQDARPLEQTQRDSDDDDDMPDPHWRPPSKQQPSSSTSLTSDTQPPPRSNGGWDILSMLVGIYGSKELFVNEYRVMLADKLLQNLDFNTDKEVHNLELLKLRFGETSMRQCEVMIKDMDDSKRINSNIRSTLMSKARSSPSLPSDEDDSSDPNAPAPPPPPVVDTAIISHIFWPPLPKESLKVHPRIREQLDRFSIEYAKLKNPRRLVWLGQLGTVSIELTVDDDSADESVVKEFECSPLHATLIMHFEDRERWTAVELSNETGVGEEVVKKKMGYWVAQRVVRVGTTMAGVTSYELSSPHRSSHATGGDDGHATGAAVGGGHHHDDDDDRDRRGAISLNLQEEEEMKVYESYVTGMLANMGQLPLERIHNMLKMFVSSGGGMSDDNCPVKYDKSPQQLAVFLKRLCDAEKLECGADGSYRLVKK